MRDLVRGDELAHPRDGRLHRRGAACAACAARAAEQPAQQVALAAARRGRLVEHARDGHEACELHASRAADERGLDDVELRVRIRAEALRVERERARRDVEHVVPRGALRSAEPRAHRHAADVARRDHEVAAREQREVAGERGHDLEARRRRPASSSGRPAVRSLRRRQGHARRRDPDARADAHMRAKVREVVAAEVAERALV